MTGRETLAGAAAAVVLAVLLGGWGALLWLFLVAGLLITLWEPRR